MRHGWPATFLLMFDEPWHLARHLARAMQAVVNPDVVLRYEMFVYCVDATIPQARARGIASHRDAPHAGFDERDGVVCPRHCTAWLALTDTDVHNGCIYVVPTGAERGDPWQDPPIDEAQGVPLEVGAGTLLMWGGHVAHWGGIHDPARAKGPRLAVTCVASVEPMWGLPSLPLPTAVGEPALPDLATRLRFIAALMQGFGPPPSGSAVDRILTALADPALAA
ncbi:MAG: phytanoyl-CoA dioxygenase family protein [Myxococcales bacterium]|nr:phytanoyl-CoA dioxygenase family protein [Myxococcales bacterium]